MNIREWTKVSLHKLSQSGAADSANLDTLILLEDALKKDRAWILAHPEFEFSADTTQKLDRLIERRASHEPLAYIRGKSEFYGREYIVTPSTLQPRPETETMFEMLKGLKLPNYPTIADIGTGSGCIAITAKLEFPEAFVFATDIQSDTLKIAQKNARNLEADVNFMQGNLLEPIFTLHPAPSVLLCNLPYVPNKHTINQAAMQEPAIAIFGGEDGLDLYRELFDQIKHLDSKPLFLLTESLPFQHDALRSIADDAGYVETKKVDFIQLYSIAGQP